MSSRRDSLSPPEKTNVVDPGAHQLAESDSEEHYSDAQSGGNSPAPKSPIPKTRVEKVDDEPSYGEVPGTEAYKMREGDAEPDEIAIIPDLSLKTQDLGREQSRDRALSPGGHPIPKTVVEQSPDTPGSREPEEDKSKNKADAPPDLLIQADGTEVKEDGDGSTDAPISPALRTPRSPRLRRKSSTVQRPPPSPDQAVDGAEDQEEGDEFGDDFDDFEEGNQDDDFGEFDDGDFEEPQPAPPQQPPPPPTAAPQPSLPYPIPDFSPLDPSSVESTLDPYLSLLFPPPSSPVPVLPPLPSTTNPIFQTPRSASLWSQLVAPPPLQPPDWIRSRIRRLFLVSLGVPVDLDEILPASEQKKLVLPSLHRVSSTGSLRTSTDSRSGSRSVSRLKRTTAEDGGNGNGSSTSVDTQGKPKPGRSRKDKAAEQQKEGRRHKGPAEPEFDIVAAKQAATTTDQALDGMTDAELRDHVQRLVGLEETAKEVLEFWTRRTDEKIGDREAFEGVIENLVKHARKVRQ